MNKVTNYDTLAELETFLATNVRIVYAGPFRYIDHFHNNTTSVLCDACFLQEDGTLKTETMKVLLK